MRHSAQDHQKTNPSSPHYKILNNIFMIPRIKVSPTTLRIQVKFFFSSVALYEDNFSAASQREPKSLTILIFTYLQYLLRIMSYQSL